MIEFVFDGLPVEINNDLGFEICIGTYGPTKLVIGYNDAQDWWVEEVHMKVIGVDGRPWARVFMTEENRVRLTTAHRKTITDHIAGLTKS